MQEKPTEIILSVKSWKLTDKYPCPNCGKKLGLPGYTCVECNIKIKPVIKMKF